MLPFEAAARCALVSMELEDCYGLLKMMESKATTRFTFKPKAKGKSISKKDFVLEYTVAIFSEDSEDLRIGIVIGPFKEGSYGIYSTTEDSLANISIRTFLLRTVLIEWLTEIIDYKRKLGGSLSSNVFLTSLLN